MKKFITPRLTVLTCVLLAGFAVLEWRLTVLQIFRHKELAEKAERYEAMNRVEQAWRGEIRDRSGIPLALSVPVKDVYASLTIWTNRVDLLAGIVAPLLGTNAASVAQRVREGLRVRTARPGDGDPGVLLLKRGVTPTGWEAMQEALDGQTFGLPTARSSSKQRTLLKDLRRWTLFSEDDQRRFYPYGETLAPVLGFVGTGTNGHLLQGRWGLEASLDSVLAGQNGMCVSSQDAAGNELAFCRITNAVVRDGAHVVLTIDLRLQKIVEDALEKVMARYHPVNASCVIIDPATGEILAMASLPGFAPQQPEGDPPANWRNHVISDPNEVGSVFKVITLGAALDLGAVNLDQQIFCENGNWTYKHLPLHDDGHHYGYLPVRECLAKSSNIGLAKIGLLVGTNRLYDAITRFGFNRPTGVPLPYETPGLVRRLAHWTPTSITRVSIGQELGISQLQLAMAYAAIANGGRLMRPMLLREVDHADGTVWERYRPQPAAEVVRPETAQELIEAMEGVVDHGTGTAAAVPGYTVAGKTGTAQVSDRYGYLRGQTYCSFVGMAPATRPAFVIAVAVADPKDSAYGGLVAAPVFREIAEQALSLYRIPPDKATATSRPVIASAGQNLENNMIAMRP